MPNRPRIVLALPFLVLPLLVIIGSGCSDRGEGVMAADIRVLRGPDGVRLFQPANDSVASSAYAQWLQLRADFAGIASTGDFIDTQRANLHRQESLLRRGLAEHWTWPRLHGGGTVDFAAGLDLVRKRMAELSQTG